MISFGNTMSIVLSLMCPCSKKDYSHMFLLIVSTREPVVFHSLTKMSSWQDSFMFLCFQFCARWLEMWARIYWITCYKSVWSKTWQSISTWSSSTRSPGGLCPIIFITRSSKCNLSYVFSTFQILVCRNKSWKLSRHEADIIVSMADYKGTQMETVSVATVPVFGE